jgi:hypothetical protein
MPNMNASIRARRVSSIINQNQGGGSKKAGFPYQVGRSMWSEVFILRQPLKTYQTVKFPLANMSRPIGRNNNAAYWHIPGTM